MTQYVLVRNPDPDYSQTPPTAAKPQPGGEVIPVPYMSDPLFDCVSCGACCFSKNPRYLILLPEDKSRVLPADILFESDDNTYVRFEGGHCVSLYDDGAGGRVCGVYEDRPHACRAFRAGSFECLKARRANGLLGANVPHEPCAPLLPYHIAADVIMAADPLPVIPA